MPFGGNISVSGAETTMGNVWHMRVNKLPAFWLEHRKEEAQRIIKYEEEEKEKGIHESDSTALF